MQCLRPNLFFQDAQHIVKRNHGTKQHKLNIQSSERWAIVLPASMCIAARRQLLRSVAASASKRSPAQSVLPTLAASFHVTQGLNIGCVTSRSSRSRPASSSSWSSTWPCTSIKDVAAAKRSRSSVSPCATSPFGPARRSSADDQPPTDETSTWARGCVE